MIQVKLESSHSLLPQLLRHMIQAKYGQDFIVLPDHQSKHSKSQPPKYIDIRLVSLWV